MIKSVLTVAMYRTLAKVIVTNLSGHTLITGTAASMTIASMDAVVEFPWMDLQRVIDVAVQQPAAGNEPR